MKIKAIEDLTKLKNAKNYREKYKRYFNIDFDSSYAVHHIDFDRNNNDIKNLLLMPRGLHAKYHMAHSSCADDGHMISGKATDLNSYRVGAFKHLAEALEEIAKWAKWKEYNYDCDIGEILFAGKNSFIVGTS